MNGDHPFFKLVKEGKIIFRSDGKIMGLNEFQIILPVRVMNRLFFLLNQQMPKKASSILKELGKFQITQAIKRYEIVLHWSKIEKEKALEFGIRYLLPTLGLGIFNVKEKKECFLISISKTPFAEEFLLEYGKQKEPIDHYVCGIWEEVFTIFLKKPMICEEIKCYAKGDDCCEFIVKPKEETEEKSKQQ